MHRFQITHLTATIQQDVACDLSHPNRRGSTGGPPSAGIMGFCVSWRAWSVIRYGPQSQTNSRPGRFVVASLLLVDAVHDTLHPGPSARKNVLITIELLHGTENLRKHRLAPKTQSAVDWHSESADNRRPSTVDCRPSQTIGPAPTFTPCANLRKPRHYEQSGQRLESGSPSGRLLRSGAARRTHSEHGRLTQSFHDKGQLQN